MVREATELAIRYIDAVLGHGKEQFGLNVSSSYNCFLFVSHYSPYAVDFMYLYLERQEERKLLSDYGGSDHEKFPLFQRNHSNLKIRITGSGIIVERLSTLFFIRTTL